MGEIGELIISAGAVSMLFLQFVIKPVLRKWILKDPAYDFSPQLYVLMVTVLNIFTALPLALLDVDGYMIPTDWLQWGKAAIVITLQALVTFASYNLTVKPMKEYAEKRELLKAELEASKLRGMIS